MRRSIGSLTLVATLCLLGFAGRASAADSGQGRVIVPPSSVEQPGDRGVRAHTTFLIYQPGGPQPDSQPGGETPASLACVYRLVKHTAGCPKVGSTLNPSGGAGAIALVDAYDNPDAAADIAAFSTEWGLPAANFLQVYANGTQPPNNPGGWSLEEALDIEWSHANAPNAQIILVEAASNNNSDLYMAESVASTMVASAGGGEVSNSWQGGEYSTENADAMTYFTTTGVVYFASSGDSGGQVGYPSVFPEVVSAGGTQVNRNGSGDFTSESVWSDAGGGDSVYESRPAYQNIIESIVGSHRGTPDVSFDASTLSAVAMYDIDGEPGWIEVGGTSVSSPSLAGVINTAGHFFTSTDLELTRVYGVYGNTNAYKHDYRDITTGSNGYTCSVGWDFCAGVGSALTYNGK